MALVAYARVSTQDQHLHLQQDALRSAGCSKIYTDTMSGGALERKGLDEALDYARAGDTLVLVSPLARWRSNACNYPYLWPATGRSWLRLRSMFAPDLAGRLTSLVMAIAIRRGLRATGANDVALPGR